jgi:RNA polymerase sigma factor (sigma-70 family)
MKIKDHLETLLAEPTNREARRALSAVVARKVGLELLRPGAKESPDLSTIASEILEEHGSALNQRDKSALLPTLQSIIDAVLDDDYPTVLTELFIDWQAGGREGGDILFEVLQIPIAKRLRRVLHKPQFGSLQNNTRPGELLTELFLNLKRSGIPSTLENRRDFFRYAEATLKNLLIDKQRRDRREMRDVAAERPLEDLINVLEGSGAEGDTLSISPGRFLDLANAIDRLPERLRDPIRYRYLWEWETEDIVKIMGISRSTLTRRLSAGLTALREDLRRGGYKIDNPD